MDWLRNAYHMSDMGLGELSQSHLGTYDPLPWFMIKKLYPMKNIWINIIPSTYNFSRSISSCANDAVPHLIYAYKFYLWSS